MCSTNVWTCVFFFFLFKLYLYWPTWNSFGCDVSLFFFFPLAHWSNYFETKPSLSEPIILTGLSAALNKSRLRFSQQTENQSQGRCVNRGRAESPVGAPNLITELLWVKAAVSHSVSAVHHSVASGCSSQHGAGVVLEAGGAGKGRGSVFNTCEQTGHYWQKSILFRMCSVWVEQRTPAGGRLHYNHHSIMLVHLKST